MGLFFEPSTPQTIFDDQINKIIGLLEDIKKLLEAK